MHDLSNLLNYRKEKTMKRNFILGLLIASLLIFGAISYAYSTYILQNESYVANVKGQRL